MTRRSGKSDPVRWYIALLHICLAPLVAVVWSLVFCGGILFLPLIIFQMLNAQRKRREEVRRFLRQLGPQILLVWHSRRGWNEFCQNNLLPALPEGIIAMQDQRRRDSVYRDRRSAETAHGVPHLARPYLLFSHEGRLRALSLNRVLEPLKKRRKTDAAVQRRVSRIILDRISTSPIGLSAESPAGQALDTPSPD